MMKKLPVLLCCLSFLAFSASCKKNKTEPVVEPPVAVTPDTTDTPDTTTPPKVDTPASMGQNTFSTTGVPTFGYWLYTPKNPRPNMPLVVYLHGGSGRGSDLTLVIAGSLPQFLYDSSVRDIPAYVLMPQCPSSRTWEQIATSVKELVDNVVASKKIDTNKISLTGHSLGGSGTWSLGGTYSAFFSCIAPLSGSVNAANAAKYTALPVWAFVGSADSIVSPTSSQNIVPMINSQGGNAQIKVYAGATHFDVPSLVYKDASVKLLDWMINQNR